MDAVACFDDIHKHGDITIGHHNKANRVKHEKHGGRVLPALQVRVVYVQGHAHAVDAVELAKYCWGHEWHGCHGDAGAPDESEHYTGAGDAEAVRLVGVRDGDVALHRHEEHDA